MPLSKIFAKEFLSRNKSHHVRKNQRYQEIFKLERTHERGENVIPKLINDLESNKLREECPKVMSNMLKHNTDSKFQMRVRVIRIFWY